MTQPPPSGWERLLGDPREVERQARAIIGAKNLSPRETAILAGHFLHGFAEGMVSAAYAGWANGEKEYRRDFRRVVEAVKKTGLDPMRGNANIVAWAMKTLQDSHVNTSDLQPPATGQGSP